MSDGLVNILLFAFGLYNAPTWIVFSIIGKQEEERREKKTTSERAAGLNLTNCDRGGYGMAHSRFPRNRFKLARLRDDVRRSQHKSWSSRAHMRDANPHRRKLSKKERKKEEDAAAGGIARFAFFTANGRLLRLYHLSQSNFHEASADLLPNDPEGEEEESCSSSYRTCWVGNAEIKRTQIIIYVQKERRKVQVRGESAFAVEKVTTHTVCCFTFIWPVRGSRPTWRDENTWFLQIVVPAWCCLFVFSLAEHIFTVVIVRARALPRHRNIIYVFSLLKEEEERNFHGGKIAVNHPSQLAFLAGQMKPFLFPAPLKELRHHHHGRIVLLFQ